MSTAENMVDLSHKKSSFRVLASCNLSAQFAEQIAMAAGPIVAVVVLGAAASETGMLRTVQSLPFLLLSIPAGILADRLSKRHMMVFGEAMRSLALVLTLGLLISNQMSLLTLALMGFLGAAGTVVFSVTTSALIPQIVPAAHLTSANRWLELGRSAAFVCGPTMGAVVITWAGGTAAYAIAFALSMLALCVASQLSEPKITRTTVRSSVAADILQGVRFVSGHDLLLPIVLTAIVFNFAWFLLQGIFVAYAVNELGISIGTIGIVLGLNGVGLVIGAFAAPMLQEYLPFKILIALGPACGFLASGLVLATLWLPSAILVGAAFVMFGMGPMLWVILTTSLRQIVTPRAMLGRVSAFVLMSTTGAGPIGAGVGALVAMSSMKACLWLSFAGFALQLVIVIASRLFRLARMPVAEDF